jgi:glucose/arabinose dehydrogenase
MRVSRTGHLIFWILALFLVSACNGEATVAGEELPPTFTAITFLDKQTVPSPLCTPPACGVGEVYHCPGECIGGCGIVCATNTPAPDLEITPEPVTATPASVVAFPDPSQYAWISVAKGLDKPLGLTHAGDGSGRSFVIEQRGMIWVFQNWERFPFPFLDIRDRVVDIQNEQGLLGLAFHPDYEGNGFFYVNYTGENGDTFISRFTISPDPNVADPASEKVTLRIKQPYGNHNGGHLLFGPDGYLYIGTGDGGSAGDPEGNAQSTNSLLGKMLRIDIDQGDPYAIPGDNPYASGGGHPEIWSIGLRNPWRYSFDRVTGDLYIGDVGQNEWEEITFLPSGHPGGANLGWDYWEASHRFEGVPPEGLEVVPPIWEYNHAAGCSVTGGIIYRGSMTEWQGIYVYGDFCSGTIWGLLRDTEGVWRNMILYQTAANITSFGEDEFGELYMVDRRGGVTLLIENP